MRSKLLVSLGLFTLLLLNACSPALFNRLGKSDLFRNSILTKPSPVATLQTTKFTDTPQSAAAKPSLSPDVSPTRALIPTNISTISATEQLEPTESKITETSSVTPLKLTLTTTSPSATPTLTPLPPTAVPTRLPDIATFTQTMTPVIATLTAPAELLTRLAQHLHAYQSRLVISDLEPVNWPDPCFDFPRGNSNNCTQVITPGFQGHVQVKQNDFGGDPIYAFRSDAAGKIIYSLPVAALAARDLLSASTGSKPEEIQFTLVEKWAWPDTCAMTPTPLPKDALCIKVPLPGWRVVLSINGAIYEYHTDVNGLVLTPVLS